MLELPAAMRWEGIPAGLGRALSSALVTVLLASESRSESDSDPEILETFPERFLITELQNTDRN